MSPLHPGAVASMPYPPERALAGTRLLRDGLLPHAGRHRRVLVRGMLFTCLLVAARLALPLPLTGVVDRATAAGNGGPAGMVPLLSAAFVSLALVAGLAEHHQRLAFAHFANRSIGDGRDAALAWVRREGGDATGDLATQVVGDSVRAKQGLKGVLNHATVNGLLVVGVCAALAVTDLRLGLVQLAGAVAVTAVAVVGAARVGAAAADHRDHETELAWVVRRSLSGEPAARLALRRLDAASRDAEIAMTRREGLAMWAVHAVLAVTGAAVLLLGVHSVRAGSASTATLFGIMAYVVVLHGPTIRFTRQIIHTAPLLVSAGHLGGIAARLTLPSGRPTGAPSVASSAAPQ